MTDAVVTFNILDALGEAYDASRTKIWVEFNTDSGFIVDEDGNTRVGAGRVTVNTDGSVQVAGIPVPSVATNPPDFQVRISYDAPPRAAQQRSVKRDRGTFGWMTITEDADLADLVAEQYAPPSWQSTFIAQAQAILAQQQALAGIDDTDSAVAYAVEFGAETVPALSASTDARIALRAVEQRPAIREATPVVCFTFDDCGTEDYTVVKPILDAKGVKGGFAFPSTFPGTTGRMSWTQIQALAADGHEIIAHSVDHSHLNVLTEAQQITQINNIAAYEAQDLTVRGFAYPFGEHDAQLRRIVRDYYDYGLGTVTGGASGSQQPLSTYAIRRIALKDSTVTADHYGQIDDAIANGEILVFLIHSRAADAEFTSAGGGYTRLADVIQYALDNDVPVLTPGEAFDLVRNTFDSGDYVGGTDYAVVDGLGTFHANDLGEFSSYGDPFTLTAATLPDSYPVGVVTSSDISSSVTDWPNGANVGWVLTDTVSAATSRAFINQLYVSNGRLWHRRANSGANTWQAWTELGVRALANTNTVEALPSTYPAGKTVQGVISPATGSPRVGGGPGTLETTIVDAGSGATVGGLNYQIFNGNGNTGRFIRHAASNNASWGVWYELPRQLMATATLDFPSVAAGSQQELTVTVTGAATGDVVTLGPPASFATGLIATGRVSAANTVTVRVSNITGSAIDPASASWTVRVSK